MTPDQLRRAAIELFGEKSWTSQLAACLGIERTSVYRYLQGQIGVPGPVAAAVTCWLDRYIRTGKKPTPPR